MQSIIGIYHRYVCVEELCYFTHKVVAGAFRSYGRTFESEPDYGFAKGLFGEMASADLAEAFSVDSL